MKKIIALLFFCIVSFSLYSTNVIAQQPKDNMVNGERLPDGYTPMEIKNGIYPRVYTPNTEILGPKEMRVTALGTGMPNVITGKQKASGWYVELGNGERILSRGRVTDVPVVTGNHCTKCDLTVTSLLHQVDLVLGISWLKKVNPLIDWRAGAMYLLSGDRQFSSLC